MAGLYRLWHDKHNPPPNYSHVSFYGKTILITGATSGLGFEAALKLLQQGVSSLIISSRDHIRGQQAKDELETRTGRTGVVEVWPLDMSSFKSVIKFASRVNSELEGRKLDAVILNAGIMHRGYALAEDGWEDTLQVNTLSTALLAGLLLPTLQRQQSSYDLAAESDLPPHLVIVSSGTAVRVRQKDLLLPPSSSFSSTSSYPLLEYLNQPSTRKKYAISKLLVGMSDGLRGYESHGRMWKGDGFFDETGTLLDSEELKDQVWKEILDVLNKEASKFNVSLNLQ